MYICQLIFRAVQSGRIIVIFLICKKLNIVYDWMNPIYYCKPLVQLEEKNREKIPGQKETFFHQSNAPAHKNILTLNWCMYSSDFYKKMCWAFGMIYWIISISSHIIVFNFDSRNLLYNLVHIFKNIQQLTDTNRNSNIVPIPFHPGSHGDARNISKFTHSWMNVFYLFIALNIKTNKLMI